MKSNNSWKDRQRNKQDKTNTYLQCVFSFSVFLRPCKLDLHLSSLEAGGINLHQIMYHHQLFLQLMTRCFSDFLRAELYSPLHPEAQGGAAAARWLGPEDRRRKRRVTPHHPGRPGLRRRQGPRCEAPRQRAALLLHAAFPLGQTNRPQTSAHQSLHVLSGGRGLLRGGLPRSGSPAAGWCWGEPTKPGSAEGKGQVTSAAEPAAQKRRQLSHEPFQMGPPPPLEEERQLEEAAGGEVQGPAG